LVTVAWKKLCFDYDSGGLGVKSLVCLNEATNLKLCWELFNSEEQWASLLRNRVCRGSRCISHHVSSSLWNGLKGEYHNVLDNSFWLIGNGNKVSFWSDNWCGEPLSYLYQISAEMINMLPDKVYEYIERFRWNINDDLNSFFSRFEKPCFPSYSAFLWYCWHAHVVPYSQWRVTSKGGIQVQRS